MQKAKCKNLLSFHLNIHSVQSISPTLPYFHSRKAKGATMAFPLQEIKLPILPFSMLIIISILGRSLHASDPPLTLDYYAPTCPSVFEIVKKEMECEVDSDPRSAALIVRLHFHDCFVQVQNSQLLALSLSFCNSNILPCIYNSTPSYKSYLAN